jgi:HAD superfamily hydrolase (TIGR01509 family)
MYQFAVKKYLEEHGFEALRPKAVLFDMDGVLYDSMPNHAIAWQESMAKFGIHMEADDAYATEGARGVDTIRHMVRLQQHRNIDEVEAQRMYDVKSQIFHSLPEAPVMPGIIKLMQQIKDEGLECGVVTGSGQRPLIQRILTDFSEFVNEDHITTAYDVQLGKPHPDPYIKGLEKAGNLKPWQAIVIENAPLGVRAGHAAKIFTIAVNTGPLPDEELLGAGANLIFPSMIELGLHWDLGRMTYF